MSEHTSGHCHCPNEHWQDYPEGGTCGVCGKQTGAPVMIPVTTRLSDYPAIGPGVHVSSPMTGIGQDFLLEPTLRLHDTHVMVSREELEGLRADRERLEFLISCLNVACWFCVFVNDWHPRRETSQEAAEDAEWREAIDAARGAK